MNTVPTKLWNKNFLLFVTGMELSSIGNGLLRFALPLYILHETGNPALMGMVLSISSVPLMIFLPVGGVVADRFSKRKVLALMNVATAIVIVAYLGLATMINIVPATIVLMLFFSSFESMITPSSEASVPSLVPVSDLVKANSLTWSLGVFSMVASPIIGGFMLSRIGLIPILFVSIACYLLATLMKLMLKLPYTKQEVNESLLKTVVTDIKESIYFVTKKNTQIGKLHLLSAYVGLFLLPLNYVALPILISTYLDMADTVVGIVQGVVMFGGTVGALLIGTLGEKATVKLARPIYLACSIAIMLAGVGLLLSNEGMISVVILVISFFSVMGLSIIFAVLSAAYFGEKVPEHLLGKISALDFSITWAGIVIGNYVFGLLLNHFIEAPWIALLIIGGVAAIGACFMKIKG